MITVKIIIIIIDLNTSRVYIKLLQSELCIPANLKINDCRLTLVISWLVLLSQSLFVPCLINKSLLLKEGKAEAANIFFQNRQGVQFASRKSVNFKNYASHVDIELRNYLSDMKLHSVF